MHNKPARQLFWVYKLKHATPAGAGCFSVAFFPFTCNTSGTVRPAKNAGFVLKERTRRLKCWFSLYINVTYCPLTGITKKPLLYKMKKRRFVIEYLYRDAGNNKLYEEAIIENPNNWDLKTFEKWYKSHLIDRLWFDPLDFGLPKPRFHEYEPELEHDWCELISLHEENLM